MTRTILVAEDSDELRDVFKQLLERNGYRVLEARDGREAVTSAVRARPELTIMDLGMPGTDGLSAIAEIREQVPVSEMQILIVSAYDRLEYRTEAVSAGCAGYLTKPVDMNDLLAAVRRLLKDDNPGAEGAEGAGV